MTDIMDWKECEGKHIRNVEIDKERISSIKEKVEQRLNLTGKIEVKEDTVSFIVENYYEAIKELLVAYLLLNGLRSKNHQCLISFFYKENPNLETEARLIARMSFYRNRLEYYGEDAPMSFYESNKGSFEEIIRLLMGLLMGRKSSEENKKGQQ